MPDGGISAAVVGASGETGIKIIDGSYSGYMFKQKIEIEANTFKLTLTNTNEAKGDIIISHKHK